jgi:nitrogen regulatory protein P-II 1
MTIKRIAAIVPIESLPKLEENLRKCGVPGVTVEHVQGYGEHPNYFRRDLMQECARLVLYTGEERLDEIVGAIGRCSEHCGYSGILAIEDIDRLVKLPSGDDVVSDELVHQGESE